MLYALREWAMPIRGRGKMGRVSEANHASLVYLLGMYAFTEIPSHSGRRHT